MRRSLPRRFLSTLSALALTLGLVSLPGAALGVVDEATPEPLTLPAEEGPAEQPPLEDESTSGGDDGGSAPTGDDADEPGSWVFTGRLTVLDHAEGVEHERLLRVEGLGLLALDLSALPEARGIGGTVEVELPLPSGAAPVDDEAAFALFDAAQAAQGALAPLAVTALAERPSAARGNTAFIEAATHRIYAVLSSPRYMSNGSGGTANGLEAAGTQDITGAISYANTYWNAQSGGKIGFAQQGGTTAFARHASYNCTSSDGAAFSTLMNSEASRAGYTFQPNTHLVLVFPPTTDCDGTLGRGTIGRSVNDGGESWNIGSASIDNRSTIAHELGHNLTFGHSNWLDCTSGSPTFSSQTSPGSGCVERPYGDAVDIMGYGSPAVSAGSLNAAHAIRGGLWTNGVEYSTATAGSSTHVLQPLSGYSGKRGVLVTDKNGIDYYVQYRDYSGDDAGFTVSCYTWAGSGGYCVQPTPGVQVLRLENSQHYYWSGGWKLGAMKGWVGDDSRLIGRTVGGTDRIYYTAGEKFSSGGVTITVQSIAGGAATVKISSGKRPVKTGILDLDWSVNANASQNRVGDTLSAYFGTGWDADSYSFQWQRSDRYLGSSCFTNAKNIAGATGQHYATRGADFNKCLRVKITGKTKGQSSKSKTSGFIIGPTSYGVIVGSGTAAITQVGTSLTAVHGGWTNVNPPLTYQWLRNGGSISGATKPSYTPVAADRDQLLSVRIAFDTGSPSYFTGASPQATSAAAKYSVDTAGTAAISGSAQVGAVLSVNALSYTRGVGGSALTPTVTRQWLRDGKAISGATASSYTTTAADYGKRISVRVTATSGAFLPHTATTAATAKIGLGTIVGSHAAPTVTKAAAPSRVLTAALAAGSVTEPGVKVAWQWLRDGKAISKATKTTYTPGSADYGKVVTVRATVTKSRYSTLTLVSAAGDVSRDSLIQNWTGIIGGELKVGTTINLSSRSYLADGSSPGVGPGAVAETIQWYRSGKAISGATANGYTPVAADVGKVLTAKIVFSLPGYLGSSKTSLATPKVGQAAFGGAPALETQQGQQLLVTPAVVSGKLVLTAPAAGDGGGQDGVADLTAKRAYQWYRSGKAISKATKASYAPSSSDKGKTLQVRVSVTKSGFSEVVRTTRLRDFSVKAPKPVITGTAKVGQSLTIPSILGEVQENTSGGAWTSSGVSATVQWLRDGKAISGATSTGYLLVSADRGKKISVRVTQVHSSGLYLSSVLTSSATAKVKS